MSFYRRIQEVTTVEPEGTTFVLAHYWRSRAAFLRGEAPARINDFIERLPPRQGRRIVTDDKGRWLTMGGTAVDVTDPGNLTGLERWRTEAIVFDRRAMIRQDVDSYWPRAEADKRPADDSNRRLRRSQRDPNGVLAEAADLVGEEKLVR